MRVGRARARLQGRGHAGALPDGARQDPAEPRVGDVRAAPAPARDRDQAGAAARVAALHQGIRRLTTPTPRPWRLVAGTVAFAAWAPRSLVGLPFAALMLATRPRAGAEWLPALAVGVTSIALLVAPAGDLLTGLVRAYIVLATAAFLAVTLAVRANGVFGRALWSSLAGGIAALALARVLGGATAWQALHWEATRQASGAMRFLVGLEPQLFVAFEPGGGFVCGAISAVLAVPLLFLVPGLATLGVTDTWLEFRRRLKAAA